MAPSLAYLLDQFAPAGDQVAVFREDITTEGLWIGVHIGNGRYNCMGLVAGTFPPTTGKTIHTIVRQQIRQALQNVDQDDAAVVVSGAWSSGSNAIAYSGDYQFTDIATRYREYTTPAATTVGIRTFFASNGGLARVWLDGSASTATLLSTAQQLVDAGTYPDTILTTATPTPGTLAPTDRVIDTYAAVSAAGYKLIASGLANTTHVIRFEATGYKRAASSDERAYIAGFCWLQGTQDLTATGIDLAHDADIARVGGSVHDYAIFCLPSAGGSSIPIGSGHGQDQQVSLVIELDGAPITFPTNKTYTGGLSASITRTSQMYHPDLGAGATVVADVTSIFEAHKDNGLVVKHTFDWQQSMDISTAYVAMFPTNMTLMDKGNNSALVATTADASLTATDASKVANAEGNLVYVWDSDGIYGAALYVPDLADVNNFDDVASDPFYAERGSGDKKIYLKRMVSGTVTNATTWGPIEVRYLANRFAAADAALNQNAGAAASKLLLALILQGHSGGAL